MTRAPRLSRSRGMAIFAPGQLGRRLNGRCTLTGPKQRGCYSMCNHYTPCLTRNTTTITQLDDHVYSAVDINGSIGFEHALSLLAQPAPRRRSKSYSQRVTCNAAKLVGLYERHQKRRLALRITGPMQDGFWIRATVVLAHARIAERMGLPVSIAYRSAFDSYDDRRQTADGWSQYFEPINPDWPEEDLVQLDCRASALSWHVGGAYTYRAEKMNAQREWRTRLVQKLRIKPRAHFWRAADAFWREHGVGEADHVLGVHIRGTDKRCHSPPKDYEKLIRMYACLTSNLTVFIATDDRDVMNTVQNEWNNQSEANRSAAKQMHAARCATPRPRYLWRDSLRGFGRFNAGVFADNRRINLTSAADAERLGTDVVTDTLLLSRANYLIGSNSAVANFAMYFNPQLQTNSFLLDVRDHPRPRWMRSSGGKNERRDRETEQDTE